MKTTREDVRAGASQQQTVDSIWPFLQLLDELAECMNETPLIARLVLKAVGVGL